MLAKLGKFVSAATRHLLNRAFDLTGRTVELCTLKATVAFNAAVVNQRNRTHMLALVVACCSSLTIVVLGLLARSSPLVPRSTLSVCEAKQSSEPILPGAQHSQTYADSYAGTNILELPAANPEFVGHWGGLVSDDQPIVGGASGHVAVVFGRRGDTVFFASRLYSPASQQIVRKPQTTMVSANEALVRYAAEDDEAVYQYSHRFVLLAPGKLGYKETVRIADRRSHLPLGIVERHAILKRVTTVREWSFFAHPGPDDVREGEISLSRQYPRPSN